MIYTKLGNSSLEISKIGLGCMSLKDGDSAIKIIEHALHHGINYFDTADLYNNGMNEIWVGKALKQHRAKAIIATKVGNQLRKDGSGWNWNPSKEYILKSVDESLKRLQTDYIDLYQLHGGTMDDPIDETIEAFTLLKQQGKIRYYGISSIRPNVIREYIKRSAISSVMMQYSLLDRRPEESVLTQLKENNIGVLARGSVASGLLVDKAAKNYLNYSVEQVEAAAEVVKSISGENKSAAQVAIQFILANPAISAAIVGIRTLDQLEDAVGAIDDPLLTDEELKVLKATIPVNYYTDHR